MDEFAQNSTFSISPETYRKKLERYGISGQSEQNINFFINNLDSDNQELRQLSFYFFPQKLKELEQALETSNKNCLELKESLEYIMKRENLLKQEIVNMQKDHEDTIQKLQRQIQDQVFENEKKARRILELEKISQQKHQELQKMNFSLHNTTIKDGESYDNSKKLEFLVKELEMRLEMIKKECDNFKMENKTLRDERRVYLQNLEEHEKYIKEKDIKTNKLFTEKKDIQTQFYQRQNEFQKNIEALNEELQNKNLLIKKFQSQIEQKNYELSELKNSIIELATIATSKNINSTLSSINVNQEIHSLPIKYLTTFIELIHEQLLKSKIQ